MEKIDNSALLSKVALKLFDNAVYRRKLSSLVEDEKPQI
jgi:hypothetical protein